MTSARAFGQILNAVFFLSGAAALTYQVCWQRILGLYYGVGPISTAIVVSIFMFGLGVGALAASHVSSRCSNPIRLYVIVEALIALFGFASIPLIMTVGRHTVGSDYSLMLIYVTLLLIIPTVLMGATLPIVVRILQTNNPNLLWSVSSYYFINTLGAAFGAMFCSYILITFIGLDGAVYTAVMTNAILAVTVFALFKKAQASAGEDPAKLAPVSHVGPLRAWAYQILILLFINGFFAIGYQIIWYRIVGVILKDSTYSFSTTLAIYLLGIGVGSIVLNRWSHRFKKQNLFNLYLWLNATIAITSILAVAATYFISYSKLNGVLAYGQDHQVLPVLGDLHKLHDVMLLFSTLAFCIFWPAFLIFVPTACMGATFPLGIALVSQKNDDAGSATSIGYTVTIAGNALGGVVTSFFLLPAIGTIVVLAIFVLIQASCVLMVRRRPTDGKWLHHLRWIPLLIGSIVVAGAPTTEDFYRSLHRRMPGYSAFFEEGLEGVVLAYQQGNVLRLWINGSAHGGRPGYWFVNEALVALSYLQDPKRVLVIGFGTGKLVNAVQLDARTKAVTIAEINRTAVVNLMKVAEIKEEMNDDRIHFVFDDGRRFLERSNDKWDLITIDPLRTRSAFSNNLYSVEFFELVKNHLSDRGVFLVSTDDSTGIIAKSLARTYDYVDQYDYFFIASQSPASPSDKMYSTLLGKLDPTYAAVVQGLKGPVLSNRHDIVSSTVNVPINRDLKPNLEYFLWQVWNQVKR